MSNKVSLLLHVLAAVIVLLGMAAALDHAGKTVHTALRQSQEVVLPDINLRGIPSEAK